MNTAILYTIEQYCHHLIDFVTSNVKEENQVLKRNGITLIIITLSLLVVLACGSSNEGTKVTPAPVEATEEAPATLGDKETPTVQAPEPSETEVPAATPEVFGVGDLIEVKDHTIRLNSIEYQGDILVANFSVKNNGTSDISISSLLSFSAKKEDGTKLEQEIFDCGESGLDGTVLPSDNLRGGICWSGASPEDGIRIYYQADLFGDGAVVWEAVEGVAEPLADDTGPTPAIEIFKVGDLVEVKEHTIRLNRIEYQGSTLIANFLVENQGDADISISSMLSFSAKRADGTKLDQEIFDCDASGLDGTILPGDRMRGSICWSAATPEDGIKIYYEASMFGEGAIVWETVAAVSEPETASDAELRVEISKVGDVIEVKDHTIVLNEVTFSGNVLKATFTVENKGTSDLALSTLLSFNARTRDGSNLEDEIFDCGTSLDGKVLPNDKVRGDVCWSGASAGAGIKIYYEANVFSQSAVVWKVE
ncbi:MAG: DUF4352 domain-containing protein [Anaerolineae bacterium]|nr:DUF4352 domain-containing protein [Anaerolineae bacterium]